MAAVSPDTYLPGRRLRALVVPVLLLSGMAVVALFALDAVRAEDTTWSPLSGNEIEGVQFLSFDPTSLRLALVDACAATGCNARDIHPMIVAAAGAMSSEELTQAIAAQARLLDAGTRALDAAPADTAKRRVALLEMTAATRLTDLYRDELRLR